MEEHFGQAEKAIHHQNTEIGQKEALAPAVNAGDDGGEPQPDRAQKQRRADQEEVEQRDPVAHSSAPPVENG